MADCALNAAFDFAQLLETVVGLGVIGLVVKRSQPFPEDVFHLSLKYVDVLIALPF